MDHSIWPTRGHSELASATGFGRESENMTNQKWEVITIILAFVFAVWALMFVKAALTEYNVKVRRALVWALVCAIASGILATGAAILS